MSKITNVASGAVLIYGLLAAALVVWYLILPAEQIIWLAVISFPTDLLFFFFGAKEWSVLSQAFVISVCGVVQYALIGVLIGYLLNK